MRPHGAGGMSVKPTPNGPVIASHYAVRETASRSEEPVAPPLFTAPRSAAFATSQLLTCMKATAIMRRPSGANTASVHRGGMSFGSWFASLFLARLKLRTAR